MNKTGLKKIKAERRENYTFDDASVKYASLTDEEVKVRKSELKKRIKDLENDATLGLDPIKIAELRGFKSSLAWMRMNKHRSKYFKINTGGASMRKAKRHPEVNFLNGNKGTKRSNTQRLKRKTV